MTLQAQLDILNLKQTELQKQNLKFWKSLHAEQTKDIREEFRVIRSHKGGAQAELAHNSFKNNYCILNVEFQAVPGINIVSIDKVLQNNSDILLITTSVSDRTLLRYSVRTVEQFKDQVIFKVGSDIRALERQIEKQSAAKKAA